MLARAFTACVRVYKYPSLESPASPAPVLQVRVEMTDGGCQVITLWSDLQAGRPLLHWGVEGGKDYKSGWRLPPGPCQPEGTVQYKDRALQSPMKWVPRGGQGGCGAVGPRHW